jgi:UDP-N-acetylglucosamine:LPS N-acetylglucosamine transferase
MPSVCTELHNKIIIQIKKIIIFNFPLKFHLINSKNIWRINMRIAVIGEMAPAKTFIPIIKQLDADIIGLTHGHGVKELMGKYCTEIHSIGQSRGQGAQKRSNAKIASLVCEDIWRVIRSLKGKNIDLLMTCGNAGDVRKGISASKILRIPNLHIEQDIYNPIEMIAFSNLITVPSEHYKDYVTDKYGLNNVHVIGGYPMASYVNGMTIENSDSVKKRYGLDEFVVLVFGGDVKGEDIPRIIKQAEILDENVLVIPFRFSAEYVKKFVTSPKLKVLDGYIELPSLMKAASYLIYGAGIGLTIEAGVLSVPSIKIAGFHRAHASVDLAEELGIQVTEIEDISGSVDSLTVPKGDKLVKNGENAVLTVINMVNNFEEMKTRASGVSSLKKIWNARSEFR